MKLGAGLVALSCLLTTVSALGATPSRGEVAVDLELVLAADASDSMDASTGLLQRSGYAAALRREEVWRAAAGGPHGAIAITYIEWGDSGLVEVVAPWTRIAGPADALALADRLETRRVARFAKTSISHAISFSTRLFDGNGFDGARRVIDVSGNGPNNQGEAVDLARDAAVAAGVTINGLPILTDLAAPRGLFADGFDRRLLDRYYAECVVGGPGAFVLPVTRPEDFASALLRKLVLEISGPVWPLPPSLRAPVLRAAAC